MKIRMVLVGFLILLVSVTTVLAISGEDTPVPTPVSDHHRGSGFTPNGCAGNNPTCGVRQTPMPPTLTEVDNTDLTPDETPVPITDDPIQTNTPVPTPVSDHHRGSGFTPNGCAGNNPTCGVRETPMSTVTYTSTATTDNPVQIPEKTVINPPIDFNKQITLGGYAKINSVPQATIAEQKNDIMEHIKDLYIKLGNEYGWLKNNSIDLTRR